MAYAVDEVVALVVEVGYGEVVYNVLTVGNAVTPMRQYSPTLSIQVCSTSKNQNSRGVVGNPAHGLRRGKETIGVCQNDEGNSGTDFGEEHRSR
jgi:hypothetical protein